MNESILKALMRLFAIVANPEKESISSKARNIVESYLSLMLNQHHVKEYLQLFDDYIELHHNVKDESDKARKKRASGNSVKVLKICSEVNEQLHHEEKLIVIVRLLEFVSEEGKITEEEAEFIDTVADVFNLVKPEYVSMKTLVTGNVIDIENKQNALVIDKNENLSADVAYKHICTKHLNGDIQMLYLQSEKMFIFKYTGSDTLFLNSVNITPKRVYVFDNGSVIKSPKITPIYHSDIASKYINTAGGTKIIFKAEEIEFYYGNTKNGIQKFSFCEESGRLIGIMGGSGVGKSTLVSIFNGTFPLHGGKITINGFDLDKDKDKLKGVIGFVPQDDLLIEELTVYQNLYYNAKLCFSNYSEKQITDAVSRVLSDLDLEAVKHLKVGSPITKFISGGQRKRLNIALELIREPSIMIVDEPTSGLSSMDSEKVMSLLKEQTLKGKLVIVNIHQPSSDIYKLFDGLLMMDKGGHPVYYGNPVDAISYFKRSAHFVNADESECSECGHVNPEQPLQILEAKMVDEYGKFTKERKVSPSEWYSAYKDKIEPERRTKCHEVQNSELPENEFKIPSRFKQFIIFSKRNILSKLTNRQYLLITFLEAPLLAVILGYFTKYIAGTDTDPNAYVFAENMNIPAYLFMAVTVALFFGLTVSAEEIIKDQKILKREKFLNLSRFSYLNSKVIVLFAISAIQTLSFIAVGNWILEIQGMTLTYWLILFSTAAFANVLGLNISASMNSVVTIYITIPFILVPQLLFSGVIVDFTKLHRNFTTYKYVPAIGDIMTSRWAYEALAVAQFKHNDYDSHFFETDMQKSIISYKLSYQISNLTERANKLLEETDKAQIERNMTVIKAETEKLVTESGKTYSGFDKFIAEGPNEANIKSYKKFLEDLKRYYNDKLYKVRTEADKNFNELVTELGDKEAIFELQRQYHNKQLSDVMKNKNEINGIKEVDGELVQIVDPIYKMPETGSGRAHFYSPVKRFGSTQIDTVVFDVLFIWFTISLAYLMLLTDAIRRFSELLGKIKFSKKSNHSQA